MVKIKETAFEDQTPFLRDAGFSDITDLYFYVSIDQSPLKQGGNYGRLRFVVHDERCAFTNKHWFNAHDRSYKVGIDVIAGPNNKSFVKLTPFLCIKNQVFFDEEEIEKPHKLEGYVENYKEEGWRVQTYKFSTKIAPRSVDHPYFKIPLIGVTGKLCLYIAEYLIRTNFSLKGEQCS